MKRKLILKEWLSLDGYVSDKTEGLDFFVKHVRPSYTTPDGIDFLRSIDTILLGGNTYAQFSALWPERPVENDLLTEKMNTLDKVVFSSSLKNAPWGTWSNARIAPGDAIHEIQTRQSQAGKHMVVWGSITLAQMLMKENLVDEYRLHLCPVITGGGRKLFTNDAPLPELTLLETYCYSNGAVFLKYGRAASLKNKT